MEVSKLDEIFVMIFYNFPITFNLIFQQMLRVNYYDLWVCILSWTHSCTYLQFIVQNFHGL